MIEYLALGAVSVLVFFFVVQPLLGGTSQAPPEVPGRVVDLQARRHYLLQAIRDVDFDFDSGKVTQAEYEETRARFIRETAIVMSELEQETGRSDEGFDRELARLREHARSSRARSPGDDETPTPVT